MGDVTCLEAEYRTAVEALRRLVAFEVRRAAACARGSRTAENQPPFADEMHDAWRRVIRWGTGDGSPLTLVAREAVGRRGGRGAAPNAVSRRSHPARAAVAHRRPGTRRAPSAGSAGRCGRPANAPVVAAAARTTAPHSRGAHRRSARDVRMGSGAGCSAAPLSTDHRCAATPDASAAAADESLGIERGGTVEQ
jgi:hypothetical protein